VEVYLMDVRTVSRWFGAVALVVSGVAITAGTLFGPAGDGDSVSVTLMKTATHRGDQRALIVANLLAVCVLPAMLYLMRMARRGSPRLAVAGGVIAFTGWLAGLLSLGALSVVILHASEMPDRAQAIRLMTAITSDWTVSALVVVFVVGHLLGMLLLGAALWRAGVAPAWVAGLVGFAPIAHLAVHTSSKTLDASAYGLVAVGLAGCAVSLLRISDADWDLPTATSSSAARAGVDPRVVRTTPAGG
jgi:hypothetical protein